MECPLRATTFQIRNRPEGHVAQGPERTLGEAGNGPNNETGQAANRIAEIGSAKLAVERASDYDALTATTRMVRDKRRRDRIAVEGFLRPTRPYGQRASIRV